MAKIVVVDDSNTLRKLAVRMLQTLGHEVAGEASDGEEACEIVSTVKPDIVLLDIMMPNMDGISTLCSIKRDFPSVRVVICSVISDSVTVKEALSDGADYYIKKPLLLDNLKKAIDLVK